MRELPDRRFSKDLLARARRHAERILVLALIRNRQRFRTRVCQVRGAQPIKPTSMNKFGVFGTTHCRGLSLSRGALKQP
jgi:hypothetical protein